VQAPGQVPAKQRDGIRTRDLRVMSPFRGWRRVSPSPLVWLYCWAPQRLGQGLNLDFRVSCGSRHPRPARLKPRSAPHTLPVVGLSALPAPSTPQAAAPEAYPGSQLVPKLPVFGTRTRCRACLARQPAASRARSSYEPSSASISRQTRPSRPRNAERPVPWGTGPVRPSTRWSGRPDLNRRPPAPKASMSRVLRRSNRACILGEWPLSPPRSSGRKSRSIAHGCGR